MDLEGEEETKHTLKYIFFLEKKALMVKYETPLSTLDLRFIHFCIVQFTTSNEEDSN